MAAENSAGDGTSRHLWEDHARRTPRPSPPRWWPKRPTVGAGHLDSAIEIRHSDHKLHGHRTTEHEGCTTKTAAHMLRKGTHQRDRLQLHGARHQRSGYQARHRHRRHRSDAWPRPQRRSTCGQPTPTSRRRSTWQAATGNGLVDHRVHRDQLAHTKTCTTGGALTCTVSGLKNGTMYTFRVRATNSVGTVRRRSPSTGVKPIDGPRRAGRHHRHREQHAAKVSWKIVDDRGETASTITGYDVTSTPTGELHRARHAPPRAPRAARSTTSSNGTSYSFTVKAINADWDKPAVRTFAGSVPRRGRRPRDHRIGTYGPQQSSP